eukprot:SAG31_NODE_3783_length_3883_cov_2.045983_2_plen_176_part_00
MYVNLEGEGTAVQLSGNESCTKFKLVLPQPVDVGVDHARGTLSSLADPRETDPRALLLRVLVLTVIRGASIPWVGLRKLPCQLSSRCVADGEGLRTGGRLLKLDEAPETPVRAPTLSIGSWDGRITSSLGLTGCTCTERRSSAGSLPKPCGVTKTSSISPGFLGAYMGDSAGKVP